MQIYFEYTPAIDLNGLIDFCNLNNISFRINIDKAGWLWNSNTITIWYHTADIVEQLDRYVIKKCIIED